jgi:hypothetical protein
MSISNTASSSSSSSHFGPSDALFTSAALSPQEREIMADITLDPDDLEPSGTATSATATGAWAWAALAPEQPEPETMMKNDNNDASWRTQQVRVCKKGL